MKVLLLILITACSLGAALKGAYPGEFKGAYPYEQSAAVPDTSDTSGSGSFCAAPTIDSIIGPDSALAEGIVVLRGIEFKSVHTIMIGDSTVETFIHKSDTLDSIVIPEIPAGLYNLVLTDSCSGKDTIPITIYVFVPPVVRVDSAYGKVKDVFTKDSVDAEDTLTIYGSGFGTEGAQVFKGLAQQIVIDSSDTILKILVIPVVGLPDTINKFRVINQYASADSINVFVWENQIEPFITTGPVNDTVVTGDTVRAFAEWSGTNVRVAWWYYHGGDSTYSFDSVFTKKVTAENDGDSARIVLWNHSDTVAGDMIYFRVVHLAFDSIATSDSLTAYFHGFAPVPDMWTGTIGNTQLTPGVPQLEESLSFTSGTKFLVTKRQYRINLSNVRYTITINFGTGSQRKIFFFFGRK